MELDLRSFLPDDTETETDLPPTHHRTVDEILNDCSSSSSPSSSPPSSPSNNKSTNFPQPTPVSISGRVSQNVRIGDKPPRPRVFSSLFGRVTPNAKPGAALAAAAAASRSVPTPHAAAIMHRRRISNSIKSESDISDVLSEFGDKIERSVSVGDVDFRGGELRERFGGFVERSESVGIDAIEVNEDDVNVKSDLDECFVSNLLNSVENRHDHDDKCLEPTNSTHFDVVSGENGHDHDDSKGLNSASFDVVVDDDEKSSFDYVGDNGINETEEIVNGIGVGVSGGFVEGIENEVNDDDGSGNGEGIENEDNGDDGGGGGDDGSSIGDVFELVEETLEQLELESKRVTKKKLDSSKKPLDLAEELEKKNASTGLHLEEGAAAQPMRLEGVRRGSITLGYFDVDADNAITRVISSQNFRREHGSAQVLVVHANYIAVGMTRGLIVVVPSKYSIHHADNTDGKVFP